MSSFISIWRRVINVREAWSKFLRDTPTLQLEGVGGCPRKPGRSLGEGSPPAAAAAVRREERNGGDEVGCRRVEEDIGEAAASFIDNSGMLGLLCRSQES